MENTITTAANLKIGTIITYNDQANINREFVVLDTETNCFGTFVNIMELESKWIEAISSNKEIEIIPKPEDGWPKIYSRRWTTIKK